MSDIVGVDTLRDVQGASRYARSYAFLYAAFEESYATKSNVRDALDCLLPFMAAYTRSNHGKQVLPQELQGFLRSTFGFEIPIYALEAVFKDLVAHGHLEYQKRLRVYTAISKEDTFKLAKEAIETDFDEVESLLSAHANGLGVREAPPSGDWGRALINFLKPEQPAFPGAAAVVKDVILDSRDLERRVAASFLQKLWQDQPSRFEKVVRIFMGTLVEDFISGISELGAVQASAPVVVFYDTAVLLRSLGCSGVFHKTATSELTRYLQDIGCRIHYLSGNEGEVSNILSAIINVKDSGFELEGETADAISKGEVKLSSIRLLQNNFVEELAKLNIFDYPDTNATERARLFQINESGFAAFLSQESQKRGVGYGMQNRHNDAGFLGAVMRLRKGINARDFSACSFVFVTHNGFLAQSARAFLIKERQLQPQQCPPMLHLSQVATIAWLLKDQKLSPALAGRELLVNCYAAAQPSAAWFATFRAGIERAVGNTEQFSRTPGNAFVLQAARRMAQEQSLANPYIMRNLSLAEILDDARAFVVEQEAERDRLEAQRELQEVEERRQREADVARTHAEELLAQKATTQARVSADEKARLEKRIFSESERHAKNILLVTQILVTVAFLATFLVDAVGGFEDKVWLAISTKCVLGVVAAFGFLDMLGVSPARRLVNTVRRWLASKEAKRLRRRFSE